MSYREEGAVATILAISALVVLGVTTIAASYFVTQNSTETKKTQASGRIGTSAEFDTLHGPGTEGALPAPPNTYWKVHKKDGAEVSCVVTKNEQGEDDVQADCSQKTGLPTYQSWCYGFEGPEGSKCLELVIPQNGGNQPVACNARQPVGQGEEARVSDFPNKLFSDGQSVFTIHDNIVCPNSNNDAAAKKVCTDALGKSEAEVWCYGFKNDNNENYCMSYFGKASACTIEKFNRTQPVAAPPGGGDYNPPPGGGGGTGGRQPRPTAKAGQPTAPPRSSRINCDDYTKSWKITSVNAADKSGKTALTITGEGRAVESCVINDDNVLVIENPFHKHYFGIGEMNLSNFSNGAVFNISVLPRDAIQAGSWTARLYYCKGYSTAGKCEHGIDTRYFVEHSFAILSSPGAQTPGGTACPSPYSCISVTDLNNNGSKNYEYYDPDPNSDTVSGANCQSNGQPGYCVKESTSSDLQKCHESAYAQANDATCRPYFNNLCKQAGGNMSYLTIGKTTNCNPGDQHITTFQSGNCCKVLTPTSAQVAFNCSALTPSSCVSESNEQCKVCNNSCIGRTESCDIPADDASVIDDTKGTIYATIELTSTNPNFQNVLNKNDFSGGLVATLEKNSHCSWLGLSCGITVRKTIQGNKVLFYSDPVERYRDNANTQISYTLTITRHEKEIFKKTDISFTLSQESFDVTKDGLIKLDLDREFKRVNLNVTLAGDVRRPQMTESANGCTGNYYNLNGDLQRMTTIDLNTKRQFSYIFYRNQNGSCNNKSFRFNYSCVRKDAGGSEIGLDTKSASQDVSVTTAGPISDLAVTLQCP